MNLPIRRSITYLFIILVYGNTFAQNFPNYFYPSTSLEFTSSDLPILIINTNDEQILDTPRINAILQIIDNEDGKRNQISDLINGYNGNISIEIRGATSQSFPKKQYSFETQDSLGNNNNVSLLGLPSENDWILHAPYSDKSLIRNALQYSLANDLGWYASRTRYCEVILNQEYLGVYILLEKIKRDKNRVDIAKLKTVDNAGDSLSGGYIIKIDKDIGDKNEGWRSNFPQNFDESDRIYFQYHYPDQDDITTEQKVYIQNYIYEFESVMESDIYSDSINGYAKYINTDSFVDYFLLSELAKNIDSYRLSTYLHKDRIDNGGKLTMGPIWDFNIAYGNANYDNGYLTSGWYKDSYYGGNLQIPFWWDRLFNDKSFTNKVIQRWKQLRKYELSLDYIYSRIDSLASVLGESQKRNFEKWNILGVRIWPNYFVGDTYQKEIDYLKSWIEKRIDWMDQNIEMTDYSILIEDSGEYALSFDGKNDFVNCGNHSSIYVTGKNITLEAWIKPSAWKDKSWQGVIIAKDQFGAGTDHGYLLRCGDDGQVDLVLGDGTWHELYSPKNLMELNEWNHVAGTFDGDTMKIFINGELVASKNERFSIKGTSKPLYIGASPADNSRSFSGLIDEVRVWNITQSQNAILENMNRNLDESIYNNSASGLVGYWKFNEGSTQATKDKTGNNKGALGIIYTIEANDPTWVLSDSPLVNIKGNKNELVNKFHISQNYPNPFNPYTTINYSIKASNAQQTLGKITLKIFDSLGKLIKILVDEEQKPGNYKINFDGSNLVSGIYYYQLISNEYTITKKMVLLK